MESLLIELSEVNDTLLDLDIENLDLSLTPIQIPKSRTKPSFNLNPQIMGDMDVKENVDGGNLVSVRFDGEPVQSKSRKKRTGFNLRKSIAWNRAFFTEEGVLNPLELSSLCKSHDKFGGGLLSGITEEKTPSRAKVKCLGLSVLEDIRGSASGGKSLRKEQKFRGRLLPKTILSPAREYSSQVATTPVQALKGVHRNLVRGGCPRPTGSSSKKKLSTSSTTNIEMKFSNTPKFLSLKPESSKTSVLGAMRSKNNRNMSPVIEKSIGLKGSLIKKKTVPVCTSSSIPRPGKDTASVTVRQASANRQLAQVSKSCTKVPLDPLVNKQSSTSIGGPKKLSASLPKTHSVDQNIPQSRLQSTKPSGLRMPSPSLRLFDESKASSLLRPRIASVSTSVCIDKLKPLKGPAGIRSQHSDIEKVKNKEKEGLQKTNSLNANRDKSSKVFAQDSNFGYGSANQEIVVINGRELRNSKVKYVSGSAGVPNLVTEGKNCGIKLFGANKSDPINQDCAVNVAVAEQSSVESDPIQQILAGVIEEKLGKDDYKFKKDDSILEGTMSVEKSHEDNGHGLLPYTRLPEDTPKHDVTGKVIISSSQCEELLVPQCGVSHHVVQEEHILEDLIEAVTDSKLLTIEEEPLRSLNVDFPPKNQELNIDVPLGIDVNDCTERDVKSKQIPDQDTVLQSSCCDLTTYSIEPVLFSTEELDWCGKTTSKRTIPPVESDPDDLNSCRELDDKSNLVLEKNAALKSSNTSLPSETQDFVCGATSVDAVKDNNDIISLEMESSSFTVSTDHNTGDLATSNFESVCSWTVELDFFGKTNSKQINSQAVGNDPKRQSTSYEIDDINACIEIDDKSNPLLVEDAAPQFSNFSLPTENQNFHFVATPKDAVKGSNEFTIPGLESSLMVSTVQNTGDLSTFTSLPVCSATEELDLFDKRASKGSFPHGEGNNHLGENILLKAAELDDMDHCTEIDDKNHHLPMDDSVLQSSTVVFPTEVLYVISDAMAGIAINESNTNLKGSRSSSKVSHSGLIMPNLDSICSSAEDLDLFGNATLKESNSQAVGCNPSRISTSLKEAESDLCHNSRVLDAELQCALEDSAYHVEKKNVAPLVSKAVEGLEQDGIQAVEEIVALPVKTSTLNNLKQDGLQTLLKPDAVPFSDEWLAALEAAGEDILSMKSGAVTNSPPDKCLPEPNPWSPVKRKNNQEIGPFDCTKKHTNLLPPDL